MSHVGLASGRRRQPVLGSVHEAYAASPAGVGLAVLAVLAVVRVAGAWSQTAMVASIALTPASVLVLPRRSRRAAGLHLDVGARAVAEGVGVVLASYAVVVAACTWVYGAQSPHNWIGSVRTVFEALAPGQHALALALAVVCMGVLVPLAEEVCYRGVLHSAASERAGALAAVLLTAGGWALVHLGDYGLNPVDPMEIAGMLPSVALMGLALGWCRVRTGSALACAIAQGIANLALTVWVFGVMAR